MDSENNTLNTGTAEITFAPHNFNDLNAECETMDLFTGFDMLIRQLDEIGTNITNETSDIAPWEQAHWIALRLQNDAKRILDKIREEEGARKEELKLAKAPALADKTYQKREAANV